MAEILDLQTAPGREPGSVMVSLTATSDDFLFAALKVLVPQGETMTLQQLRIVALKNAAQTLQEAATDLSEG